MNYFLATTTVLLVSGVLACRIDEGVRECTQPGNLCETCTSLVSCIYDEETQTFEKEHLDSCNSPNICVDGACRNDTRDPFCDGTANLTFPCEQWGVFPHPFCCDKSVYCVGSSETKINPYVHSCPEGFGFNIANDLCDIPLTNGQCPDELPVPLCQEVGQTDALDDKPAMYYLCQPYTGHSVEYPYLRICDGDEVYEDHVCKSKDGTTTTIEPTTLAE